MTSASLPPPVCNIAPLFIAMWFVKLYLAGTDFELVFKRRHCLGHFFFPLQIPFNWILSEIPEDK